MFRALQGHHQGGIYKCITRTVDSVKEVRINGIIGMCRMRRFFAVRRSFFHSSVLYALSFYPFPPTSLPSSLTSSCHLFLGLKEVRM